LLFYRIAIEESVGGIFEVMKKTLTYIVIMIFCASCATPKAMDIRKADDDAMTCNELKLALEQASLNEDIAHSEKGMTDGNILSGLFFFPAYFVTYGTSVHAQYNASERKYHLIGLFKTKGCSRPKSTKYQELISERLIELEVLKSQFVRGLITEDEYILARKQLLIEFD
jgi:hypothetical protein